MRRNRSFVSRITGKNSFNGGAQDWIKSSLSYGNGQCVEVAGLSGDIVMVRDSKNVKSPVLGFTPGEWDAFVGGVRNGEFDRRR